MLCVAVHQLLAVSFPVLSGRHRVFKQERKDAVPLAPRTERPSGFRCAFSMHACNGCGSCLQNSWLAHSQRLPDHLHVVLHGQPSQGTHKAAANKLMLQRPQPSLWWHGDVVRCSTKERAALLEARLSYRRHGSRVSRLYIRLHSHATVSALSVLSAAFAAFLESDRCAGGPAACMPCKPEPGLTTPTKVLQWVGSSAASP